VASLQPAQPKNNGIAERLYRGLLLAYPASFRARFAEEMVAFFHERRLEPRYRTFRGALSLWLHLVGDVTRSAPTEWLRKRRGAAPELAAEWEINSSFPESGDYMDTLLQDLRYAVRTLVRRPGFASVAVLTLALGIGANTAIFSVVNAVLLRPLPWPESDRLAFVAEGRGSQLFGASYMDYLDWRDQSASFDELAVLRGQSVNLTGGETPQRVTGAFVTANYFTVVGAAVAQGRLFTRTETEVATKQPVAILSDAAWRTQFGARPDLLGSTLVLNGQPCTVVGILRSDFLGPMFTPDVLMPIGYYPNKGDLEVRGRGGIVVLGRMKAGISPERAQADVSAITRRLGELYPKTNGGMSAQVQPLKEQLVGQAQTPLLIVLSAVAAVLLIACANVANLQLARAAARRRELSVRAALGAGRSRLMRQLLTESVVLSLAGGLCGLLVAQWTVKSLSASVVRLLPLYGNIAIDRPVLFFALGVTALAGVLFGLAPALQASRADVHDSLTLRGETSAAAGRFGARGGLVVAQIAMCVVLLVSAGLLTRSLVALSQVKPGFDPEHLLTMQFRLPPAKYPTEGQIADMFTRTLAELRAVPGVQNAALVRATPLNGNGEMSPYEIEGKPEPDPEKRPSLHLNVVSPGYFETVRLPRRAGRDFIPQDREGAPYVVIVNEQLARKIAPNGSAVGRRIRIAVADSSWATVVGVVANAKHFALAESTLDQAYVSYMQRPLIFTEVVVRASGDPMSVSNAARSAIWRVDRDQPVWAVRSLETVLANALGAPKFTMWLVASFALVALLLATIGVYGVMSYTVAQRTQELGVRMALGARSGQVLGMVVKQGMTTIAVAVAIGTVVALGLTRLLATQLFGVSPKDPLTFVCVAIVLAGVALVACFLPALRASRVDPIVALRSE
jgi:putative ABC transport system permease protein